MRQSMLVFVVCALVSGASFGCAPKLGDGCTTRADCSVNNDRDCDRSQPGGYCTIENCEPGSCGDEGVCVRFKPDEPRLSSNWCMATCSDNGDCDRDRYTCKSAKELNPKPPMNPDDPMPPRVAEVLEGNKNQEFCVVKD